ncbi:MAG: RagB/SusD family nutrient uptake outer membrane protein [Candidatus Symbiothrix sp.]|jgi:hypothetical protein|nr:RagB/SusD family nutrient uptake outer membrane protein [Candidatus Symbiothrix sp.]
MKKLFNYNYRVLVALALSLSFFACDGDNDGTGGEVEEPPITNDATAVAFVKGIVKSVSLGSGGSFTIETLSEGTISFEGDDTADGPLISLFDVQPNNAYVESSLWNRHTGVIAQANDAIEQISALQDSVVANAATGKVLSTANKNLALGGAYFARGLAYFYLVQIFGEVPIYTSTENASNGVPESVDKVYQQAERDFKKAEELLPVNTGTKTYPNKYAAQAILSKAYLTWSTVTSRDNANTPVTADAAKLANAVTYADKVISSAAYQLEEDFLKTQAGRNYKFGKEHILNFSYVLGDARPGDGGNHQSHCAFSYGFDADPNTEPTHIGPASYDLYTKWDNANVHNELDQRREFSYTTHLAKPGSGKTPDEDSVYVFNPTTGWLPIFGKGIDRTYYEGPLVGPTERDLDRLEIRYAEVLLIKAEALIESNQNLSDAKGLINTVRRRAYQVGEFAVGNGNGLTPADIEVTANDQVGLRAALRQERKNEFVYEQKRWLDLIRWHNLTETVLTVQQYPEYTGTHTPGSFFEKAKKHLQTRVAAVKANPLRYYRLPIPDAARATNPNLVLDKYYQ